MSLADELLADLEEGTEDVGQDDGENVAEVADVEDVVMEPEIQATRVTSVAKLRDSQELAEIMNNIKKYSSQSRMDSGEILQFFCLRKITQT